MKLLIEDVEKLHEHIWLSEISRSDLDLLEKPKATEGTLSVIFVENAKFDSVQKNLSFKARDARFLNLGTSNNTLFVDRAEGIQVPNSSKEAIALTGLSKGDSEFIKLVDAELSGSVNSAAKTLLEKIRSKHPGSLKRGQRNNFSNEPDNFWYVIVQPRKQNLSITVRGRPELFVGSSLDLKDDRPGYTRFYLSRLDEVDAAVSIIDRSLRR